MSSNRVAEVAVATEFDPALDDTKSLTDFACDAYLQRGDILDKEVRDLVEQIDTSNKYLAEINKLIAESNRVLYQTDNYSAPTWSIDFSGTDKTITLDNGYKITLNPNGNVVITDAQNHSLTYSAFGDALFPVNADGTSGNGISLTSDTSIILGDSTKITFQFNGAGQVTNLVLNRGNQGLLVTGVNNNPVATGPNLDGLTLDAANNDGNILLETDGVYDLEQAGSNIPYYDTTNGILSDDHIAFINNQLKISMDLTGPLTPDQWKTLKDQLTATRDNLTGSNQLQTVQLQSALTRYNQNYDAMSNSQNKIYTLLKDILGNLK